MNMYKGALFQIQSMSPEILSVAELSCLLQPCLLPFSIMQTPWKVLPSSWKTPCVPHTETHVTSHVCAYTSLWNCVMGLHAGFAMLYFSYHSGFSPEEWGSNIDLFLWHVLHLLYCLNQFFRGATAFFNVATVFLHSLLFFWWNLFMNRFPILELCLI